MNVTLRICLLTVLCTIGLSSAFALPRFAARTGAKCQACHVDPAGGGMRQMFGVQYGREHLPFTAWSKEFEMEDFTNLVANVLGVGADFRTLYYYRELPTTPGTNSNAFFQMQGDIYLNFHVARKVNMYLSKGLYSGFQIFGLIHVLPANGYIKVGKFLPNFGLKTDDHTVFTRTYTGFSPELGRPELTGGEVALSPGPFTIVGGVFNAGEATGAVPTGNAKAFLGRVEGMFNLAPEVNLGIGVNVFTRKTFLRTIKSLNGNFDPVAFDHETIQGAFASISYHNLTLLGEGDLVKSNVPGSEVTGLVTSFEADYMAVTGADLKVGYDYYDQDKDLKNGAVSRYSVGVEFFPISGVELRPVYRFVRFSSIQLPNYDELDLVMHFFI